MNTAREIIAVIAFLVALYFAVDLFNSGFTILSLVVCVMSFMGAYIIWPSKKQGQRNDDNWLLDIIEFIIELPAEVITWLIRLLARLFSGKDDGVDFDL